MVWWGLESTGPATYLMGWCPARPLVRGWAVAGRAGSCSPAGGNGRRVAAAGRVALLRGSNVNHGDMTTYERIKMCRCVCYAVSLLRRRCPHDAGCVAAKCGRGGVGSVPPGRWMVRAGWAPRGRTRQSAQTGYRSHTCTVTTTTTSLHTASTQPPHSLHTASTQPPDVGVRLRRPATATPGVQGESLQ